MGSQSAGTDLSPGQLESLWINAGGPPAQAKTAAAIALAESHGDPSKDNTLDPSGGSFGLWQINGAHLGESGVPENASDLYDPTTNAAAAVAVYKANGNSFNPWSTYTSQKYLAFMPTVANAVSGTVASIVGQSIAPKASTTATAANPLGDDPTGLKGALTSAEASVSGWGVTIAVFLFGLVLVGGALAIAAANSKTVQTVVSKLPEAAAA